LGQQFCYSHGAYDADGDSIVYELIPPRGSAGNPLTYFPGYSAQQPLASSPGMSFDTQTGDFCFTPQMMEVTVMAVLVKQYRNGVLIGTVERDIQVTVINCSNVLPQASGINGTNSFSITACADQPVCFNINSADLDSTQNVTFSWDYSIPGAVFSTSSGNRPVATFCWTPSQADIGSSRCFTATVQDDACPVYGLQTYTYCIAVEGPLVNAGPDVSLGCSGITNATLNAVVSNGTAGNYSYQWSNGAITPSTSVGPGTHVVSVTSGGCTSVDTVIVYPPTPPPIAAFQFNSPCLGSPVLFVNNSTSNSGVMQFNWDFGGVGTSSLANPSYTFSSAGSYNVTLTVTDLNGCTSTLTRTVAVQPSPLVNISPPVSICAGQNTALSATGGTSYLWTPGNLTGSSINVAPSQSQVYQVIVSNASGCTSTSSVTVTVNPLPNPSVTTSPVNCAGSSNGSATVQLAGGTPPYSYQWSNGSTNSSLTGLAPGTYSVQVTDAAGCSASVSSSISSPLPLNLSITGISPLCFGGTTGTASVSVSGGTAGYTYLWSPGAYSSVSVDQLPAGNYTVVVADNNGCTASAIVTLTDPPVLALSTVTTPSTCGASDGTAVVTANGGTGPYQYIWSVGSSTASSLTGLNSGTYAVTVTDANGCSNSTSINIPSTNAPSFVPVVIQDVSCYAGSDGSAQAGSITGNAPFTYQWSNGSNSDSISGIPAGTYSLAITDINGCISVASITVQQPAQLSLVVSSVDASCFGGSDGNASAVVSGGTPGYVYQWSGSAAQGNSVAGLSAGNYSLFLSDANGCVSTQSFQINEPLPIQLSLSSIPVSCNGGSDGIAYVDSYQNANNPVQFTWSVGAGNSDTITGLSSGTYGVVITDQLGCTSSGTVNIAQPAPLSSQSSVVIPSCYGYSDGSIGLSVSGGIPAYQFAWSTGDSAVSSLGGLMSGQYDVMITDANNCTLYVSQILAEPTILIASASGTPATCGVSDGSATSAVTGGTVPYQYQWTSGAGYLPTADSIPAGLYSVLVNDANGCTASATAVISNVGAPLASALTLSNVSCNGGSDGVAVPYNVTGNAPFTYSWSSGSFSDTLTGVPAGTYTLIVTDANGCQVSGSTVIDEPTPLIASVSATDVTCFAYSDGTANALVNGGTPGYSYSWPVSSSSTLSASGFPAGNFNFIVTDANGCTATAGFLISQPPAIALAVTSDSALCDGASDGMVAVHVSNGVAPFSFDWGTTGTPNDDSLSGVPAGNYNVIVTDANGCSSSATAVVFQPDPLLVSMISNPVSCYGGNDGSIISSVSVGSPGYTYLWQGLSNSTSSVSSLSSGYYDLLVTDLNGCSSSASIAVQEPANLGLSTSSTPATCGVADGTATVNPTGGTAPYSFEWAPGQITNQIATNLFAGGYAVLVTDANGCTETGSAQVSNIGAPSMSAIVFQDVSCSGGADGIAVVQFALGNGPFSFVWGNGISGDTAYGLVVGTYPVIMTDINGCVTTDTVQVSEPAPLTINIASQPVSCNAGNNGSAFVTAGGGVPGYVYMWSGGQSTNPAISGLVAGSYMATVTDMNGCSVTASISVYEPPALQLQLTSTPALCFGSSDGSVIASASGGTGSIAIQWTGSNVISDTVNGLSFGYHSVTATDANGCFIVDSILVDQPTALSLSVTSDSVSCTGFSDGSLEAIVTGGTIGYSYAWSPLSSNSNQLIGIPAGAYQVAITDANGCTASASADIIDPDPLTLSLLLPPVICIGQTTPLVAFPSGGTSPLSLFWSTGETSDSIYVSPIVNSSYSVGLTDANGCSLSPQTVTVFVNPPLAVSVSSPLEICEGETAQISSSASGGDGGPYVYSWNGNSILSASAVVVPATDSAFTVTISDGCSPDVSATVLITVHPLPEVEFTPQQFVGCSPVTVQLSNVFQVPFGSVYSWDLDETVSNEISPTYTYTTPGYYDISLSITTPEGCSDAIAVQDAVHVYGYPTAIFEQSTESVSVFAPSVELQDLSIDAVSWAWDFGDGTVLFGEQSPTHVYSDSGTFTIQLIVTNDGGCTDTVYGIVRIEPEFTIFIPNAFTPNGDGKNDFFFPVGENIVSIEMWILDRWGLEIFHSTSFELQWDGTYFANQPSCQNDLYEYVVDAVDLAGRKRRYIG
ncbi:MAG: PKD domain-containing protein, partial [Bacteroidota bacterium]